MQSYCSADSRSTGIGRLVIALAFCKGAYQFVGFLEKINCRIFAGFRRIQQLDGPEIGLQRLVGEHDLAVGDVGCSEKAKVRHGGFLGQAAEV